MRTSFTIGLLYSAVPGAIVVIIAAQIPVIGTFINMFLGGTSLIAVIVRIVAPNATPARFSHLIYHIVWSLAGSVSPAISYCLLAHVH